jgi:hypothetical protein
MTDACESIRWLTERYPNEGDMDAQFSVNPLGPGCYCTLGIRSAGIHRSATAPTTQEAAIKVADAVAKELGWTPKS